MSKRYCIVPQSESSWVKTPDKLFLNVPKDPKMRKKWMKEIRYTLSCTINVFVDILSTYIAGRLNVVTPSESKGIATLVGTFALPSLIFLSLARLDFSSVNWTFLLAILLAKSIVFFSVIIVTLLVSKPLNFARAGIFAIFCTQSNDFALGYPIINAIYEKAHPEYALYLYLMAPISLAILNPVAFIFMEISKHKAMTDSITNEEERKRRVSKVKLAKQLFKGIAYNPVLAMTILGILGNVLFKHKLSVYIEGLLQVFGNAFSASALFLLGLRMVGQIHRLRGPALVLPCVLIMVKLIILPVVMRECVSGLKAGDNETETNSLSTYAFLYGTIPTAPAVFVFSNLYQLEIDLIASSMVICTFLSAPMMYLSAQMISINKDYADQIKKYEFELSIVALLAAVWVNIVFCITKQYKKMPHRLTMCLIASQVVLAIGAIWGWTLGTDQNSEVFLLQQAIWSFGMFACPLWTSMLSVGVLMFECRGTWFVTRLWPVLCFVAWGAPAVMVGVLLATSAFRTAATDAIRLCLLVFCLTITTGCLIIYVRFRRRAQVGNPPLEVSAATPPDETTSLVENAEPISNTQSLSHNGCYGTITADPSTVSNQNSCCTNDPDCAQQQDRDIEDICENGNGSVGSGCGRCGERERRGGQLLRHTALVIVNSLSMFLSITYTAWKMMRKDESGVFIEIEFLDITATYGQALIILVLFGLDPEEIIIPIIGVFRRRWTGGETIVLPPVEELSFETKHVCDQFITHHLDKCKQAIAKDTRVRMRTYRNAFRGVCLVRWLVSCGLARDEREAEQYGRHLLDARLITHVNNRHHFTNSQRVYVFQ